MNIKKDFEVKEISRTFEERLTEWQEFLKIDRNEAANYYTENIFPEVIKKCAENTAKNGNAAEILNPDYMILTVGTSFEPLVLSISTIQPKKEILFLYTEETRQFMAKVIKFLELSVENYITEEVDRSSTVKIDRIVKEQYGKWKRNYENNKDGGNGMVVIDFTGGTKAMSGGGAMSALLIDAKLVYVDSIYDSVLRIPFPGSEYINLIKNPYEISGAIEYEKSIKLFEEGDYKGTLKILRKVLSSTRGSEYERYNLLRQLSYVYSCWEDIDFKTALSSIENLLANIEAFKNSESEVIFLRKQLPQLNKQKAVLESLKEIYGQLALAQNNDTNTGNDIFEILKIPSNSNNIGNLIFFIYEKAQRSANRGDYNIAVLLLYRMTELISRRRLAVRGINSASNSVKPEYYGRVEQALRDTYSRTVNHINVNLEHQMTQYAYLKVLEDGIFNNLDDETSTSIAKLREFCEKSSDKRNSGFYIHGFRKMDEKDYDSAKTVSEKWLRRFCNIEKIDFDKNLLAHTFLTPKDFN